MAIGVRSQQANDKDRPYWVWIWQGDLTGGGTFGSGDGWQKYDQGYQGRQEGFDKDSPPKANCIANCGPYPRGRDPENPRPLPVFEIESGESINDPIPADGGKPPTVTAITPEGVPGQTGAIVSFFPPMDVQINCQQSPLRIEGGQIETIYDLTISARGYIKDFDTDTIIVPFNVTTVARGPGPIVGYTVSQYTFATGLRDLRANIYYLVGNELGDFSKNFRLSFASLLGGTNNITLEGNNYYFDVQEVTLDNLVRADGLDDQCGTSECSVRWETTYYNVSNPNDIFTSIKTQTVPFTVSRIGLSGPPNSGGQTLFAYSEGDTQSVPIEQAFSTEVFVSAALLNISCSYDVNGQLPGCFIESPETCNVTIKDQAGILLDQTYFGRPRVELFSEYPEELFESEGT